MNIINFLQKFTDFIIKNGLIFYKNNKCFKKY